MSGKQHVHAAGVVLWRHGADGVEYALVHRPHREDWSLPKGHVDPGETTPHAAVRETVEETGYTPRLGAWLGQTRYRLPVDGRTKIVTYYAGWCSAGEFTPNKEVDELRWCTGDAARKLLSYPDDGSMLDAFERLGTQLHTVLLVRHAKAGNRADWDGDDEQRPLSHVGHLQAEALDGFVALWQPETLHAAPRVRCVDTLAPLARRRGAEIVSEPLLSEEGYAEAPDAGTRRLLAIAESASVSAVCSQGGAIPGLVARLAETSGLRFPERPHAKKGSVWVLSLRPDPTHGLLLAAADYYPTALPKP